MDPSDVTFYSNRSACYAALEEWQAAFEDGRQCVIVDRSFVKGYFRAALAAQSMNNLDVAIDFVKRGLGVDSTNVDLKKMSREIEDNQRLNKVDALAKQAETQLAENDIYGAYKTIDAALRLEPTAPRLNRIMDKVRPLYEREEKKRISSLDSKERLKEEGDKLFKEAKFEEAIKAYSKALDAISDKVSDIFLYLFLLDANSLIVVI